jgi:PhnB protein
MAEAKQAVPNGYSTVTPIVTYDDCASAIEWYKRGLGAQELSRHIGPDGKVMHAEIQVGNSRLMVHDAMMGAKGAKALGGSPIGLWVYVEDCDTLFNRAISAGAEVKQPVMDQFWGDRCGMLTDPHGLGWTIATHKEDLTTEEMNERSAEFFKQFAEQAKAAGAGA